ncbi:hypothetical protein [Chitinophaga vietnamensis]|uniref:hypothetical protein n=1 Tax=Chitinophaga vietnamensis TaxID=2593957 RepID=UPI0011774E8D|nr:hypothetical protein [Chitinophaga vietnamensis]
MPIISYIKRPCAVLVWMVLFFICSKNVSAQCVNWSVGTTVDSSLCIASGRITVKLTGPDLAGMDSIQYSLDPLTPGGTLIAKSSFSVLDNIRAGEYKLKVEAMCAGSPVFKEVPVTVPGNYKNDLEYSGVQFRPYLNSCIPGKIQLTIKGGRTPYTIRMLKSPAAYTGIKTVSTSQTTFLFDSLITGHYVFDVIDACGSARDTVPVNVSPANMWTYTWGTIGRCDTAVFMTLINLDGYPSGEVSMLYHGQLDVLSSNTRKVPVNTYFMDTVPLPKGKSMEDYSSQVYKGFTETCGSTYPSSVTLVTPYIYQVAISHNCNNTFSANLSIAGYAGCYPLTATLINQDNPSQTYSNTISNQGNLLIKNVPYGNYTLELRSSTGKLLYTQTLNQQPIKIDFTISVVRDPYNEGGYDGIGVVQISPAAGFPVGTTISMVYPRVTQLYTVTEPINYALSFYGDPPNTYYGLPPGFYIYKVVTPCDSFMLPVTIRDEDVYHFYGSYDAVRSCNGLKVIPKGNAVKGAQSSKIYFQIADALGKNIATGYAGDTVTLPLEGNYKISYGYNYSYSVNPQTINYKKTPMDINSRYTLGFVCPGRPDNEGQIRIRAMGGESGNNNYTYYLSEVGNSLNGPYIDINTTGAFRSTTSYQLMKGHTYEVRIRNSCNESIVQAVTIMDFANFHLASVDKPYYCYGDKLTFKVVNLPSEAIQYKWSGPNVNVLTNGSASTQQLVIRNATNRDSGLYKVVVNTDMCDAPLIGTVQVNMARYNPVCYSALSDTSVNPYTYGLLGNWRTERSYTYYSTRSSNTVNELTNIRKDGTIRNFMQFWQLQAGKWSAKYDTTRWVWNTMSTIFSKKGFELENKDPLGRYNAGIYGYDEALPVAVVQNARYRDAAFDGFEDYFFQTAGCGDTICPVNRHFDFSAYINSIDSTQHHTGRYSLKINAGKDLGLNAPAVDDDIALSAPTFNYGSNCAGTVLKSVRVNKNVIIPAFSPVTGKQMLFSIWVKEEQPCNCTVYTKTKVMVFVGGPDEVRVIAEAKPTGVIIDGWQRYEQVVKLSKTATSMSFVVTAPSSSNVYIDDIRLHPYNANMKSFVYDPQTLRLMAELDENNYATFYEYDDDGTLNRVKKETERGVKTISETRSGLIKEE